VSPLIEGEPANILPAARSRCEAFLVNAGRKPPLPVPRSADERARHRRTSSDLLRQPVPPPLQEAAVIGTSALGEVIVPFT
jgi:hypothetical protein